MIKELQAFSHGQIQDALNILKIINENKIDEKQLYDHMIDSMKTKQTRKLSRKQREREFAKTKWGRRRK